MPSKTEKLVFAIAFGIAAGYAGALGALLLAHCWFLDAGNRPVVDDFLAFWTAGRLALKGMAVAAYDAHLHAAEAAFAGHNFHEMLGWSYPPLFLFVAALLAVLPYAPAFITWSALTLGLDAFVTATIAERRSAFAVACAAPWTLTALWLGQNGFLTASLIGLVLLHLERRQALAGILLGLLSYKPQFGILFPLALAAGGYWRAFAFATATALAVNGVAGLVFGFATFGAFLHALSDTTASHLTNAGMGLFKPQSVYGLMRTIGAASGEAWAAQLAFGAALIGVVTLCWRSSAPFPLKAAILAAAVPLATPYVFAYDMPVLGVAAAFLFRHHGYDRIELVFLAATFLCVFAFPWLPFPSAFLGSLTIGFLALRRFRAWHAEPAMMGSFA